MKKEMPVDIIRIKVKDLKPYKKTSKGWVKIKKDFKSIQDVVKLYKAESNLNLLIDNKNPQFLKGAILGNKELGERIVLLPNGEKLEKAFSLFSEGLTLHDQKSHDHWDVIYKNKGGTWSYVYTLQKRKEHRDNKYRKVHEFEKRYPQLLAKVTKSLSDKNDSMALPMYTLLRTYMRIGNETYFKAHNHQGLTTLTKKNVSVKGNNVSFNFIGKDGVPITIIKRFPESYVKRLKESLKEKQPYLFSKNGSSLHEHHFKEAFVRYCGKEFYPHIVRSHHATIKVKEFLSKRKKTTKNEVENLFMGIAHDLGHKKFNKKKGLWEEHYAVTVNSYIQPELVEKVQSRIK
ncbi:MAG: hypothetical protein Q8Q01_02440 [archaeon]|nr:hypothetical protein [archaeon]